MSLRPHASGRMFPWLNSEMIRVDGHHYVYEVVQPRNGEPAHIDVLFPGGNRRSTAELMAEGRKVEFPVTMRGNGARKL